MAQRLGIDHPLVLVRDIEATAARYRSLGFNTAPTGRHPWGTSTSLMMFDRAALELMSVYDESLLDSFAIGDFRFGRHMADALAEREGVTLVALYSQNATADRARVEAQGISAQGRVDFRRRVKIPSHDWDEAVVSLEILLDPGLPRASNFICQQHRPELVWVPEWLVHPNGALGFAALTYAATNPAPVLDRFARLFGADAVAETTLGHVVQTGAGVIRVVRPGAWARHLGVPAEPDIAPADVACVGIDIRVADLPAATALIRGAGVTLVETAEGAALPDFAAYGQVLLRFVPAA